MPDNSDNNAMAAAAAAAAANGNPVGVPVGNGRRRFRLSELLFRRDAPAAAAAAPPRTAGEMKPWVGNDLTPCCFVVLCHEQQTLMHVFYRSGLAPNLDGCRVWLGLTVTTGLLSRGLFCVEGRVEYGGGGKGGGRLG